MRDSKDLTKMKTSSLLSLFIRADASLAIGAGHVMRCIALGQVWQDKGGRVVFISHCESKKLRERIIAEGFDFIYLENHHPHPSDLDKTIETLSTMHHPPSTNDWLIVDGYHFDSMYQKKIKEAGHRLLWIDDYGHADHYYADIVLNQNISADASFYAKREPVTRLLLGTRYCMLRREFRQWQGWQREIPDTAKKILVTLGGGDPDNVTLKIMQALKQVNMPDLEAKIVVGPTNPNLHTLQQEISDNTKLQIITNATNMPELMAWADLAVSAGGSTCWEMALLGLPNMIIFFADNQRPIAEKLHADNVVLSLGWGHKLTIEDIAQSLEKLIRTAPLRKIFSINSKNLVDGAGALRVCREAM